MAVEKLQTARLFLKDLFASQKKKPQTSKIINELGDYTNEVIKPYAYELQALANSYKATIRLQEKGNLFMVNSGPITSVLDYTKMDKTKDADLMGLVYDNIKINAKLKKV